MAVIDDLKAYWPMDEASGNAIDAHSTHDLAAIGFAPGATTGKVAGGRDFELGTGHDLSVASHADLETGDIDFSLQVWVNLESKPDVMDIFSRWSNPFSYTLLYDTTGDCFKLFVYNGATTTAVSASTFGSPSTGTWYLLHAGHSAAADEIWISVNAGTVNTAAHTGGSHNTGSSMVRFGGPFNGVAYDGIVDEAGYWKRDIRSDRAFLYNAGAGVDYAAIVAEAGGGGAAPWLFRSFTHTLGAGLGTAK